MGRKKVILVIVEGPSDQSALRLVLERVFSDKKVFVKIAYGDVTSDDRSNPANIVKSVNQLVVDAMNRDHFLKEDMLKVIHLMDSDGAYIPDDAVTELATVKETVYNTTGIIAANKVDIITRNKRKAANMDKLAGRSAIGGIPYLPIYMSCNLDHVLHNKINSTDDEKRSDSFAFAKKYRTNISAFISFITESDFSVKGDRSDTWEYLRKGLHSLERHTNLGLCLPREN